MSKIFKLKGAVQNYAWGGNDFIPDLLGIEKEPKTYAEYWLGAHVNAPAKVLTDEGEEHLDEFIQRNSTEVLGVKVAKEFGRLPYLFKILDVKDMLSIQVHPTKPEAEKGFAKENELGIPLTAPNRNYKDDNHKPEIMVALGEFWLLHGFLTPSKLLKTLKEVPEFNHLIAVFDEEKHDYFALYQKVMEETDEITESTLRPLINRVLPQYTEGKLDKANPDYWTAMAVSTAGESAKIDKGIYSIYFFNLMKVNKGEAVFQDAGIPHAYLEGQNMELMANSDNVLRAGLTPKHVDVPELLKHVDFKGIVPNILTGQTSNDGSSLETIYDSPVRDFVLSQITLGKGDSYHHDSKTAEILMVMDGGVAVFDAEKEVLNARKGEALLVISDCYYKLTAEEGSIIYKASAL
ncbi:MAG: mannose-6-phosphate isomerase [Cyclobacteriaceae bacterium]|jgi:mannose-6-phosphate isomerase